MSNTQHSVITTLSCFGRDVDIVLDQEGKLQARYECDQGVFIKGSYDNTPDNLEKILHESCTAIMADFIEEQVMKQCAEEVYS